ncbi:MAG: hypothetical protein JST82_07450 [Bacteroidetes bacterium]|nr:hypothetical protein [Bacteroidota bacterium]
MFEKLKNKWNVNNGQLLLIICCFALGGTLCGRTGKMILDALGMEKGIFWVICYLLLISLLWPVCVLLVSIPLGQYKFFNAYVKRILKKIGGR